MKFAASQTKLEQLTNRLHYLLVMSIGLLVANVFLVLLAGWAFWRHTTLVVPTEISQPFTIANSAVDASYLQQMALFFISERLNITPQNVEHGHKIILQHTDAAFYNQFVGILNKEKESVMKQNISSAFYPQEVLVNSKQLLVKVKGSLAHWVGSTPLVSSEKHYVIKFTRRGGRLKVASFAIQNERA